ncbi:MAG TPA: tandem-95 repeat protein [Pyrinomonadaceae bacterium]|jgi:hypothetical protein
MRHAHPFKALTGFVNKTAITKKFFLLPLLTAIALAGVIFSGSHVHSSDQLGVVATEQQRQEQQHAASIKPSSAAAHPGATARNNSLPLRAGSEAASAEEEGERAELSHSSRVASKFFPSMAPIAPIIAATKLDALVNDDGDGKIDPTNGNPATEERITYTVTITNTGGDATHLKFTDTIDTHTTLVPGSVNTQPIANDDTYQATGNVRIQVPVANGVLVNDLDPDGTTLTSITAFDATSANGGTVTMTTSGANAGAFTYNPPAGFEGTGANADTFTYTVSDGTATATATVKIDVSGMVWFINANAVSDGDGRLTNPFKFLSSFAAINDGVNNVPAHSFHPAANDNIFLYESGTSYTAPVTLLSGQKVIGQDSSASLTSLTGITPPTFSDPFPAVNSGNGTFVTIGSAAGGILLNSGNLLRGFNMSGVAGTAIQGTNFGTLSAFELNVASSGQALSLTTGTVSGPASVAAFGTLSSGGGTNGVLLSGVAGTLTAANGTLTGTATGPTFAIVGGSVNVTYSGNITQAANNAAVSVTGNHQTGTITFNTGTVSATNGTGLQFDNADGTYNFSGTTTLNGGNAGIDITNNSFGTFSFNSNTSITNPTNEAITITGGGQSVTYSGSISKSNGTRGILIQSNTAGTILFDGPSATETKSIATTGAANAIDLLSNSGTTINFTNNNLVLSATGSGVGLNATGGGTVTVQGTGNTITTATGSALNVSATSIGASGLTFQSINVNGATSGIVLNNTGTGALSVTGTGTTAGSGGTIQNTQQGGVFTTTTNLSLKNMNFTNANTADGGANCSNVDSSAFNSQCNAAINMNGVTTATFDNLSLNGGTQVGINGQTVSNFSLLNSTVQNFGDEPNENDVRLFNLTGTATINNCDFSFAAGDATGGESLIDIRNTTSTALTLNVDGDPLNVNKNNFTQTQSSANGSYGLTVTSASSANVTVNVRRSDFLNIRTAGIATFARGTSTMNVNITGVGNTANGNSFDPGFPNLGRAIDLNAQDTAALNFNINENPKIYGTGGPIINVFGTVNAQINGHIRNNPDIRNASDTLGATAIGSAIYFHPEDSADGRVEITGNTISKIGKDQAILLLNHGNGAALLDGIIDGIVASNNISIANANANNSAIYLNSGANAGDVNKVCGYIHNNTVTTGLASHFAFVTFTGSSGSNVYLQNFSVDAAGTWTANANTETGPGNVAISGGSGSVLPAAGNAPFNGTCRAPTNAVAMLTPDEMRGVPTYAKSISPFVENAMSLWTGLALASNEPMPTIPQSATLNESLAWQSRTGVHNLFNDQVYTPSAPEAMINGTANASLLPTTNEVAVAEQASMTAQETAIADTASNTADQIASASTDTNRAATASAHPVKNRNAMVLSHAVRTRTRPSALAAAMLAGETITIDGGAGVSPANSGFTLPAGKSITVTFQVTLNNTPNLTTPIPVGGAVVSNQGTVTADGGVNVLTDDTAVGGASDPTKTPVDLFNSQTDVTSSNTSVGQGDPVTFTATVSFNPTGSPSGTPGTPTGAVQFTIDGNPLVCDQGSTATQTLNGSGVATCTTSTINPVGSPHTINAIYSGDGNFETSTDASPVSQTVIACIANPVVTSNADSGANTLRDALANVCNAPNNNITFNLGAGSNTITALSTLVIAKNANIANTITGTNGKLTITANGGNFNVFRVDSPVTTASLNGFTVTGASLTGSNGGGLLAQSGTVTLTNMLFTGNTVINGDGGGVAAASGTTLNLRNSTISGNTAREGGGLASSGGTFNLLNVTITNNNANGNTGTGACPAAGSINGSGGGIDTNNNITNITNTIISGNIACGPGQNASGAFTTENNNLFDGDQKIAALADNGGLTRTHALLAGSPALDAGDNTAADAIPLTTDQRGAGFSRKRDAADADTTQTVDIGAFEADPSVEDITDKSTNEDTLIVVPFNVGDAATAFDSITATSGNTTLVPNLAANINITGSGSSRNLNITPAANETGTSTITVTATKTISGTAVSMSDTFVLTVNAVNDAPSFTLPGNPPAVNEDSGAQTVNPYATSISQGPNETGQTLTFNVSVTGTTGSLSFTTAPAIDPTTGALTYTPAADTFGTASVSVTLSDDGSNTAPNSNTSGVQNFTITVNAVNDPPSFTLAGNPPSLNENAGPQTVNNFATSISQGPNETGQTPLTFNVSPTGSTGTLTFSTPPAIDATTGTLTYTPSNGTNGTATFNVTLSDSGSNTVPNSNTSAAQSFTITVNGVNDPPVNTAPAAVTMLQDTVLTFTGVNAISVADPDAASLPGDGVINVSLTATNGTLNLNGTAGLTITSGANGTAAVAFDGAIADINTALNGMQFTPPSGYTGAASVQIVSDDKGKTGTGGVQTDTDTVNITVTAPTAMYINEILFNPDSSGQNEYIELRGTPSSAIPVGTYLVAVDGDAGNLGDVTTYINLSGLTFGSNGFLVLLQNGNTYTTDAGATVVSSSGAVPANAGFKGLPGGIFQADGGADSLENDSVTFMLVQTSAVPNLSDDIDTDNNGAADGAVYDGWSIRDSIGVLDGTNTGDRAYGAFNYSYNSGTNGSATGTTVLVGFNVVYVGRRGDTTGSAAADWVASSGPGGAAPNFTLDPAGTKVEPSSFAGKTLDHIGSTNFLNKVPVNTGPFAVAQTTDEDVPLTFNAGNANLISIGDPDAGTASLKVTLTATNGTFSLSGTGGLTFTPAGAGNDGTNDAQMIFTGALSDINAALNGLTFTPTANYSGSASLAILTDDQGNTGVDGAKTDSDTVNITVNAVNDPPSFIVPATAPTVNEDAGAQSVSGFASSISQGAGDPAQALTFNVSVASTTGNLSFSSAPAINSSTGELTYTTSPNTNGSATINVSLSDNGSNVLPNSNTSGVQQFTINVTAVNDAPTFQIAANPSAVNEDASAQTVAGFATNFLPGPATATDEAGQTLAGYTVTQTGTTGNLTFTSGPSIDNAGQLTYTPTGNTSGTATFNVVATDSGSGTAPNVNQSAPVSFTITVTGQNDAPLLDNTGNMSLSAISEDIALAANSGTLVSDIIASAGGDRITDVDAGAVEGIAVNAVNNTSGAWQYTIDGGTNWTPFGTPDAVNSRLLAANALTRVRFVPNAEFNGTINPGITFHAWDQSTGTNGNTADTSVALGGITPFSTATETASITVTEVNDAPVANADALSSVGEDSGLRTIPFATLTGNDSTGPANESAQTLIVKTVGLPVGGTVSISGGNVLFTPTADYNGPASFQYTVEDNGTTNGAAAPITSAAATVSFNITPTPDTPSVTNATTNEDTQTTSGLVITRNAGDGNEVVNFKITGITGGTLFQNDGVTPITNGSFITVAQGGAGLKFTPAANSTTNGSFTVQASLSALDAGLGGGTATATITINPVNDAPTLDAIADVTINEDASAQTVNLSGIGAGGGETQTLVVTATSNNTSLIPNPAVTYTSPNATGTLSFTPVAGQSGSALITVTVNDGGGVANGGVQTIVRTFTVTVNAVNDAPVNAVPGAQTTNADTALTFSAANGNAITVSDVDAGPASVRVTLTATGGTLSLSSTFGLVFTTGDGTSDATMTFTGALSSINGALNGLTFTPTAGFSGAASLQITTDDLGNTGLGGALSDTDTIAITVTQRSLQFSAVSYTIGEEQGHATITVTRTGNTGAVATVDFETSDLAGLNNCSVNTGDASARCDYTAMGGTLTFAAGEASRTFNVPIINDVYVEGLEHLTLTLSNPTGGVLGATSVVSLSITDDDLAVGAPNPIDNRAFFIRQLYLDFLNRQPEPSGLAAWLNRLNTCPQPGETLQNCDEIEVASAFFRSPEYFDRAYFIFKVYEEALGRQPQYDEYQHDILRVTGFLTAQELEARKQQFVLEFTQRQEFKNKYDGIADSGAFVDELLNTAGVQFDPAVRAAIVSQLANSQIQRWDVLRIVANSPEVSQKFFNKAFAVVAYFAFLRRNPDINYLHWIQMLNTTGDYREMIRGFMQSPEYRLRFGPM